MDAFISETVPVGSFEDAICAAIPTSPARKGVSESGAAVEKTRRRRRRSNFGDVEHGFGKGLRVFLRQIVPYAALDRPVLVFAGEFLRVGAWIRVGRAIGVAFKGDRRHGDDRTFGKPLFQIVVFRLAFSEPEPPAVIVDHDGDVIGIVEGRCAAIERGIIEGPLRRSDLPYELGKFTPVFVVAGPAAVGAK